MKTQLVIFGVSGDLSRRKLLPALNELVSQGLNDIEIIGVSRRKLDDDELLGAFSSLRPIMSTYTMDLVSPSDYSDFAKKLLKRRNVGQRLYYLAVPPGAATSIVDFLGAAGLNTSKDKILFEKPFGYDHESASSFIDRTARFYLEKNIFRIDHYMAKEVAKEVIRFKKACQGGRCKWGLDTVRSVEIIAHEELGVEGRAEFYEQTGAIRDVVQGHLMQLLSLVLMRPDARNSPGSRLESLKLLKPVLPENVVKDQYEGYPEEVGVTRSETETFARLTLFSEDPNWLNVPLTLETGKKMPKKQTCIKISYKNGPDAVFDELSLVNGNQEKVPDAYEKILQSAINGEKAIFTSSDEVLESWRILDPAQYI